MIAVRYLQREAAKSSCTSSNVALANVEARNKVLQEQLASTQERLAQLGSSLQDETRLRNDQSSEVRTA